MNGWRPLGKLQTHRAIATRSPGNFVEQKQTFFAFLWFDWHDQDVCKKKAGVRSPSGGL
jgi:hypothetical protein